MLQLKEVVKPIPADNEILITVHAVSVNRSDWERLAGTSLYARMNGLRKPRHQILGSDVAGRVEAAGKDHTDFQPGDEVFGEMESCSGGFAEYVCTRGRRGAGTFAIQLAKSYGADVTVDNAGKLDFMRSLGADHVIDYAQEDFTRNGRRYDLILDLVADRSVFVCARALRPEEGTTQWAVPWRPSFRT